MQPAKKIKRDKPPEQAYAALIRLCARSEKSSGDALRLMQRWGVQPSARQGVLQKLLADRFIDEMSGGQRQRAFIAMVLAQDTDVIFLDEPTNNLDIRHSLSMMRLLRRLADELGKTVILVLHEINLASFYSDRICAFKDGRLAFSGTPAEVMTEERLRAVYGVDFRIVEVDGRPMALYH